MSRVCRLQPDAGRGFPEVDDELVISARATRAGLTRDQPLQPALSRQTRFFDCEVSHEPID